ncbi:MAG TPA: periplasmic heavy metal sensor [Pantanalinema sp.]
MTRVARLALLASCLLAPQVSGCGKTAPPLSESRPPLQAPERMTVEASSGLDELKAYKQEAHRAMGLSDAQKAQLREAMLKRLKAFDLEGIKADYAQLGTLVAAPTFDADAARALVTKMEGRWRDLAPTLADAVAEGHAMLSDEQRKKAIEVLGQSQARLAPIMRKLRFEGFAAIAKDVTLTSEQNTGLHALMKKDREADDARLAAMIQAETKYYQDQDKQALAASFAEAMKVHAGQEAIAWAATLDPQQRQKVVENSKQYAARLLQAMGEMMKAL